MAAQHGLIDIIPQRPLMLKIPPVEKLKIDFGPSATVESQSGDKGAKGRAQLPPYRRKSHSGILL